MSEARQTIGTDGRALPLLPVFYGVLKLKRMEADDTRRCPPPEPKPGST